MLRMYLLQIGFNLSDVGVEEAIDASCVMKPLLRLEFYNEHVTNSTTLLKWRHLLEQHQIGEKIF